MNEFIRNAWYVAAQSAEIGRPPAQRWVLGDPVALFRSEAGTVVALADRCSHRRFPLSRGRLIGDRLECAYHGFTFAESGACVAIPSESGAIPARAAVRRYPAVERSGWVWLWMGAAERADESLIPDYAWVDSSARTTFGGCFEVKSRYELMLDNLLDLTHLSFLHSGSIGNDYYARAPIVSELDGERVTVKRLMERVDLPPFHEETMRLKNPVDRWNVTEYTAPSFIVVNVGARSSENPAERRENKVTNAITPRTATTFAYFWSVSFDYPIPAEARDAVTRVLNEDVAAVELQETMIATDRDDAVEYNSRNDAAVVRARRIRNERLTAERGAVAGNVLSAN